VSESGPVSEAHVLYIDDDEALARLVTRDLTRNGLQVTHVPRGEEGLRLLADQHFDVVALDHYMPGQDGLVTLAAIRALPDAPPVVYVTGSDESRVAVAALKAGAAEYVIKTPGRDFFDLLRSSILGAVETVRLQREKDAAEQEIRAANSRLEQLVAQQQLLMREVNHRVANSLQIVSSLMHMQAGRVADPEGKAALLDTQRRVDAITQVHRRLYSTGEVGLVEMDKYLEGLVEELGQSMSTAGHHHSLNLTAAHVSIPTDKAVSVGILVTELVINAYKYAYPGNCGGEVRVILDAVEPRRLVLSVEDDGVGMPAVNGDNGGRGLGQQLISAMASRLGATVGRDPGHRGTRISVAFAP
jgi:two-component sensor histidine kinase